MNYRLAYAIGFHPWEDLAEHPPFAGKLLELVAREEVGREPPYGPALDLGTGSAVWGVQLAKRGWRVTGVDIVEKALRRARERVDEADVEMRLVRGDVTALRQADVGSGFRLVLDTGTFHGLSDAQREAMGREVSAIAAPDATVLLDCFAPLRRGPLPRGASRAAVEAAFPGWDVTDVEIADTEPDALARLFKFGERFYRLRRNGATPGARDAPGVDAPLRDPTAGRLRLHRRAAQLAGVLARPDPRAAGITVASAGRSCSHCDASARPHRRARNDAAHV
jgi:Methyltransferase domain